MLGTIAPRRAYFVTVSLGQAQRTKQIAARRYQTECCARVLHGRLFVLALVLGLVGACADTDGPDWVAIPRPLAVSVDDCGWQSGPSLAGVGGPWRIGARDPTLEDYRSLARIAQATGSRLVTLWVMSELDRNNICARPEYNMPEAPSDMTEAGLDWDNTDHVNDDNFALMDFMRDNAAWLEMGIHGVRHEHWEHGQLTRAEFGKRDGHGWGLENSTLHLRCFAELIGQYFPPEVDPFPVNFVPPDHGYETATENDATTGAALASFGVRYAQLPGPTRFDNGVLLMDRDTSASPPWDAVGSLPGRPPSEQSWIMTHLPNYYESESGWIDWLQALDRPTNRLLPKNAALAASQLIYSDRAHLDVHREGLTIDTREVPTEVYAHDILGPIALKLKLDGETLLNVTSEDDIRLVASYRDSYNHVVLLLGQPDQPQGRLSAGLFHVQVHFGQPQKDAFVDLHGSTFNVFSVTRASAEQVETSLEVYGQQTVQMVLPDFNVNDVHSDNPGLAVQSWTWDPESKQLRVDVLGTNMQGERAHLVATSTPPIEQRDASP